MFWKLWVFAFALTAVGISIKGVVLLGWVNIASTPMFFAGEAMCLGGLLSGLGTFIVWAVHTAPKIFGRFND